MLEEKLLEIVENIVGSFNNRYLSITPYQNFQLYNVFYFDSITGRKNHSILSFEDILIESFEKLECYNFRMNHLKDKSLTVFKGVGSNERFYINELLEYKKTLKRKIFIKKLQNTI